MKGFGVAEYMYVVISTEPVHLLSARVKLMTSEGKGCEWKRRHSLVNCTDEEACTAVTTRSRLQQVTNDPGPLLLTAHRWYSSTVSVLYGACSNSRIHFAYVQTFL